jgi:hypothetical protein
MPLIRGYEPRLDGQKLGEFLTLDQCRQAIQNAVESLPQGTGLFSLEIHDHSKGEYIHLVTLQDEQTPITWQDCDFYHWLDVSDWKRES